MFFVFSSNKTSKDGNLAPFLVSDVFIDGEDEHERKEEASPAKDMPDVMPEVSTELVLQQIGALSMHSPIVEVEHLARLVQFPGFCRRQI